LIRGEPGLLVYRDRSDFLGDFREVDHTA
jgi:hypothetical protein